jgi:protein-disulfide isomerase
MITKMQVVGENKLKCFLLLLSFVVLAAAVVIAASSGGSTSGRAALVREPNAARRANALLSGIPQHGSVLGYREAPVTLQFFGDLQCTTSRRVMLGALPFLIRNWVRRGKLQIRFRSFETDTKVAGGWPVFREQQIAALAAGEQEKLWNFIDVFYREQGPELSGYVSEAFLRNVARQATLYPQTWKEDRALVEAWVAQLEADEELALAKGLNTTPSFLVGRTGGTARPLRHFGLEEPQVFEDAIRELL